MVHALQLMTLMLDGEQHGLINQDQVQQQRQMIELLDAEGTPEQTMEFLGLSGAEQTVNVTTLRKLKEPIERGQVLVRALHLQMSELVETYL
jgi:Arc/MetJ family transcription regulator